MNFEQGQRDRIAWDTSPQFAQFSRATAVRDIMRLFLPPVPEDAMQVSCPLPKPYRDWIRGFNASA